MGEQGPHLLTWGKAGGKEFREWDGKLKFSFENVGFEISVRRQSRNVE